MLMLKAIWLKAALVAYWEIPTPGFPSYWLTMALWGMVAYFGFVASRKHRTQPMLRWGFMTLAVCIAYYTAIIGTWSFPPLTVGNLLAGLALGVILYRLGQEELESEQPAKDKLRGQWPRDAELTLAQLKRKGIEVSSSLEALIRQDPARGDLILLGYEQGKKKMQN